MQIIFEKPILIKSIKFVKKLISEVEKQLIFHKFEHNLEVASRAVYLWEKEWLKEEDLELLAISWIFHDSGFSVKYNSNEEVWAEIAEKFLKEFWYPKEKIEIIKNIIIATKINIEPKNILEKIIKDADLDNLWRDDFLNKSDEIKKEIENNTNYQNWDNIKLDKKVFLKSTLCLIKNHKFYTETAINERQKNKLNNIKILEKKVNN